VRAATTKTLREENEMYELVENGQLQPHQENGRKVTMERPTNMAREDRETRPYVVRDLSWEFARYLDAEDAAASASTVPKSTRES
jgi:hypothetical protein